MGEEFMFNGKHVLIVYDDLTKSSNLCELIFIEAAHEKRRNLVCSLGSHGRRING